MKQKSWIKLAWSFALFSLLILTGISTSFAQRVRRLGVSGGCNDTVKGCWSPLMTSWPLEAVHSNLVTTGTFETPATWAGKVLMWDEGVYNAGNNSTTILGRLWDPVCGTSNPLCFTNVNLTIPNSGSASIFCSGHSFLADGKLLVTGGGFIGTDDTGPVINYWFDPFVNPPGPNSWRSRSPLQDPVCGVPPLPLCGDPNNPNKILRGGRFYPTNISMSLPLLPEAVLTFSGDNIIGDLNSTVEVYDRFNDFWTTRSVNTPIDRIDNVNEVYPHMHLFPIGPQTGTSGSVFYVAKGEANSWLFDPTRPIGMQWAPKAKPSTYRAHATSVLLPLVLDSTGNVTNQVRDLIVGGCDGTMNCDKDRLLLNLNSSQIYRLNTDAWDPDLGSQGVYLRPLWPTKDLGSIIRPGCFYRTVAF